MDFEKAVSLIGTVTDLRRVASAHVIDHNQLKDDELRSALVKSKPRYTRAEPGNKKAFNGLPGRESKRTRTSSTGASLSAPRMVSVGASSPGWRQLLPTRELAKTSAITAATSSMAEYRTRWRQNSVS